MIYIPFYWIVISRIDNKFITKSNTKKKKNTNEFKSKIKNPKPKKSLYI